MPTVNSSKDLVTPHAQSHSVGGADPIPELQTLGNRLTPAEWNGDSNSASFVNCTLSYAAGEIQATATTTSIGVGWAGGAAAGKVSVQPGQIVTATALVSIKSAAATRDARMRIYFRDASGGVVTSPQGSTVVIPLGGAWVELRHTTVAPAGAALTSSFVNINPVVAGEVFALKQPALWFGAGGVAQPPGTPIPGLHWQRTSPTGGVDWILEHWNGSAWVLIDGDTGQRNVGASGVVQRRGQMVAWTATDFTAPIGFRDSYATGGKVYLTTDSWPTTLPGTPR